MPVSGWTGDNLAESSRQATWYTGPTLAGALDAVETPKRATDKPLRMPVQVRWGGGAQGVHAR